MRRCIIWGADEEYESILNQVKYEELKGNLTCAAVLSEECRRFIKKRDGFDIIGKEELQDAEFDYLIIAVDQPYAEIKAEAAAMGIANDRIIHSRIFKIPNFDFQGYTSLREDPVTILSNDCWGGIVYHELDLQFTSPLVNIYWTPDSYCEFMRAMSLS